MRKHRSWLMGLGIGLILGASMLKVMLIGKEQAEMVAGQEPISRERLQAEAKMAGFVLLPVNEKRYTQQELDAKIAAAASSNNNKAKPAAPPAKQGKEPRIVTLNVRSNMTLSIVAEELQKHGVIEDAGDFMEKAESIEKKLKIGTAVFIGKPTYKQIMTELTRSKD
ncbi:hypothetical protein SD71_14885 [Cohnella kolymensis]|uniref:Aminodeoxychorismate lyase n=1 Tax=Cohnella kolymensis TaxID=1590652 RepID=A0ABR5A3V9_9BACL|nr:hypothetical protein [Cohnella kolymensis]KIL35313.1 hypothetical protein SD71_14885 [Cohnella kolymensis]